MELGATADIGGSDERDGWIGLVLRERQRCMCMQPIVEDTEILVDGWSVLSSYRKDTATQWGSGGNWGRAVKLLQKKTLFLHVQSVQSMLSQNLHAAQTDGREWSQVFQHANEDKDMKLAKGCIIITIILVFTQQTKQVFSLRAKVRQLVLNIERTSEKLSVEDRLK